MITLDQEFTDEQLQELLATCEETGAAAARLANQALEPLRALLHERADRYRRSAEEIRECLHSLPQVSTATAQAPLAAARGTDVAALWETAECEALMHFRDALDSVLPGDVESAVLRHIEDGARALERLRVLRSGEDAG